MDGVGRREVGGGSGRRAGKLWLVCKIHMKKGSRKLEAFVSKCIQCVHVCVVYVLIDVYVTPCMCTLSTGTKADLEIGGIHKTEQA